MIRVISRSSLNEKIPWCTQKNGQKHGGGEENCHQILFFRPAHDGANESVSPIHAMFEVMHNSVMNTSLLIVFQMRVIMDSLLLVQLVFCES